MSEKQFDLIKGLNNSFKEELNTPSDLIMDRAKQSGILPGQRNTTVKSVGENLKLEMPPIPPLEVDGYKLPRTNIPHLDALTIMMYIFAKELSTNPRIKSILDQVNFKFPDLSGNIIYPPATSIAKPTKRKPKKHTK